MAAYCQRVLVLLDGTVRFDGTPEGLAELARGRVWAGHSDRPGDHSWLTADGHLRPCLCGDVQSNLRDPLRRGEPLEPLIRHTLSIKPERHWHVQGTDTGSGGLVALSQVGG